MRGWRFPNNLPYSGLSIYVPNKMLLFPLYDFSDVFVKAFETIVFFIVFLVLLIKSKGEEMDQNLIPLVGEIYPVLVRTL